MLIDPQPGTTRIVICGEVASGKSTVLNCLLRERLLPDNLGAPVRPFVAARWAADRQVRSAFPDGSVVAPAYGDHEALRGAERILLQSSARHLKPYEFLELPMSNADNLTDDHFELVRSADLMIWVTIASQAWRLTEQRILDELATVSPGRGLIALSRADKLRTHDDAIKLMERVANETEPYFDAAHFVCGTRELVEAAATSRQAWTDTGAPSIMARIEDLMARPAARAVGRDGVFPADTIPLPDGHRARRGDVRIDRGTGAGADCMFRSVRVGDQVTAASPDPSHG